MNSRFATGSRYFAIAGIGSMGVILAVGASGVRINMTPSIPPGIYWPTREKIRRGDIVAFCPPVSKPFREALDRRYIGPGDCPGGSYEMLKRFSAARNDHVKIGPEGVAINGRHIPESEPQAADGAHRPLPSVAMDRTLKDDEVLVLGDSALSFDSRYFGPVRQQQIDSAIRPLVTW